MAYTKYSLTPGNNTAAPPDGAPEGMLPSAVNDTMRDMMSQIRDVGDGIRGGTYTMTAPVITGGSITGVALSGNTLTNPVITGGSINNTPIGASTANTGAFTTLSASSTATLNTLASSGATLTGGSINNMAVGASTASTGAFTTLSASSTVSGSGFSSYLASPPAIGGTAAAAVSSTNLAYTGTLTGGTGVVNLGSGQFYKDASGNVGIGTSIPNAYGGQLVSYKATGNGTYFGHSNSGTFPKVSAIGLGSDVVAATYNSNGSTYSLAGSAQIAAIQSASSNATTDMAFYTTSGGSVLEKMRIDSSGNIFVGGTSGAVLGYEKFSAYGSGSFKTSGTTALGLWNTASSGLITFYTDTGTLGGTVSAISGALSITGGTNLNLSSGGANIVTINTNGSERMRITNTGNVGIGTSSPSVRFQVAGGDSILCSDGNVAGVGGTVANGIYKATGAEALVLRSNSAERMRIDSSGNVGVGTSSPAARLDAQQSTTDFVGLSVLNTNNDVGTATSAQVRIGVTNSVGASYAVIKAQEGGGDDYPALTFGVQNAATTNPTERMRIDSSGNLLVGTTSTISAGVIGNFVNSTATYRNFYVSNTSATNCGTINSQLTSSANNTSSYHFVGNTGGTDKVYIYGNGNIVNTGNSYGTLSDAKLKENIVDASAKLNDVMKLKVRNFNLKSDPNHKQIGFVAQELEQVFPSMVDETQDRAEDGSTIATYTKSIKTSVLVPILVKAIQEQQVMIENLTTRLNALEGK